MSYPLCRHILTNGLRCKSPALRESAWCFYHRNLHDRHSSYRHTEATRGYLCPGQHIQLTALEDRESVQVALSVVINALATGRLETKRATALLYGLQLASSNAATLNNSASPSDTVQTAETTEDGLALAEPAVHEPFLFEPDEDEDDDEDDDLRIDDDGTLVRVIPVGIPTPNEVRPPASDPAETGIQVTK